MVHNHIAYRTKLNKLRTGYFIIKWPTIYSFSDNKFSLDRAVNSEVLIDSFIVDDKQTHRLL
jgi:hypothetical protein